MSRKKRYIKKLTEEQKASLEKVFKTSSCQLSRKRAQCILLSNTGKTVSELAAIYSVRTRTIYSWFDLWESNKLAGIKRKPGQGRKLKLDPSNEKQTKLVKELIKNEPKNLNKVLTQVKSGLALDLSKKTLKRFLKNLSTVGNASVSG